uniref:DDE Tnp4 domain-containing protein n=1 Tax=Nothobranchius kuhntae TaxID=321403 RepID=A0A1A8JZG9_NOTKU
MEHCDVFRSVILFFVVTILQIQTKLFIVFQMLNRRQQDENVLIPSTVTLVPPPPPAKTRSHQMKEEAKEIARRFEASHHIPQITGLIDGTHIPILPPSNGYKDFVNRKGWPSYLLQAVVDDKIQGIKTTGGRDTNLSLVGDPAYPLLDWLIKGYLNSPRLTLEQESFNTYISSVRVGVELTFGLLKSRWRVLLKISDFHFTFAPTMIATCCALHNFCQNEEDQASNSWLKEACDRAINFPQPNQPVDLQCSSCGSST